MNPIRSQLTCAGLAILSVSLFAQLATGSQQPRDQGGALTATTPDRRRVVLNADGTWRFDKGEQDAKKIVNAHGLTFELVTAKRTRSSVVVFFSITSNDEDRTLQISSGIAGPIATAIDEAGNTTDASCCKASIGNQQVYSMLAADVPTKASLRFDSIPDRVKRIRRLSLPCLVNSRSFDLVFRDINID
jgi:hypothetical protein